MVMARLITALVVLLVLPWSVQASMERGERPRWHPESVGAFLLASSDGKHWENMSPEEREALRRRKAEYDALSPHEQRRLRDAREKFKKMPPERQREIRERWEKLSPEEKERFRLDKELRKR